MPSRDRLIEAAQRAARALLAGARSLGQAMRSRGLPLLRAAGLALVAWVYAAGRVLVAWVCAASRRLPALVLQASRRLAALLSAGWHRLVALVARGSAAAAASVAAWAGRAIRAGRRHLRLALWALLLLVVLTAAGAAIAWAGWQHMLTAPLPDSPSNQVFVVSPGQSTTRIADNLFEAGLIRHPLAFRLWARQTGEANRLQAGEYRLSSSMSVPEILDKLVKGQVILYPVTVPEGYTMLQIEELLVRRGLVQGDRFREALAELAAGNLLPPEYLPERQHLLLEPLEGYLFPDTYHFPRGVTEREIVRAMVSRLLAVFTPELVERAAEMGMTVSEVLTLGSIIEKEARVADERPLMSGVFHNRMRIGMPLQADPTVRYVMPDPKAPITPREWAIDSPYNTYVYRGLPPGPISNVGEASIIAALYPAETAYFYFVARPDGSHAFARTYPEHVANVRRYIR